MLGMLGKIGRNITLKTNNSEIIIIYLEVIVIKYCFCMDEI